jgi:FkbM family methyltransferase
MNSSLRGVLKFARSMTGPLTWGTRSFAQEGEDLVLSRVLAEGAGTGFYVEVGCHHPFRFSNTYLFYRRGWRGICIDPIPGTERRFRRWRPRDITLEQAVALQPATLTYYMFNEPALNTFDAEAARRAQLKPQYVVVETRQIRAEPLAQIIEAHLPPSVPRIDFFSIDVDGLDLEVLRSNDWQRYAPRAVVAESFDSDLLSTGADPIVRFMSDVGYRPYAKTGHSVIFMAGK